jgi:hypothetical protein
MFSHPISFMKRLPQSKLEWRPITDYLKEKGYSHQDLRNLTKDEAHRLRIKVFKYL